MGIYRLNEYAENLRKTKRTKQINATIVLITLAIFSFYIAYHFQIGIFYFAGFCLLGGLLHYYDDFLHSTNYENSRTSNYHFPNPQIAKEKDSKVVAIKSNENFFIGVGDHVTDVNGIICVITELCISGQNWSKNFNDLTVEYVGKSIYAINEIDSTYKHAISRISTIQNCEETIAIINEWWEIENKRRDALPRYIVKLDYPGTKYYVGQILNGFDSSYQIDNAAVALYEKHPEIFQKTTATLSKTADFGIFDQD